MPTTHPRINLTVTPDLYATVDRLARLSGQPKTRVILDLLEPAAPFLNEVANLLETAQSLKMEPANQLTAKLAEVAQHIQAYANAAANDPGLNPRAQGLLTELMAELASSEGARPPSSNTGVKMPN